MTRREVYPLGPRGQGVRGSTAVLSTDNRCVTDDDWYTVDEAAQRLGMGATWVRDHADLDPEAPGYLAGYRTGGHARSHRRIYKWAVDEILAERKRRRPEG